ncbi:MAG TPA: hypothetical protein VEX37_06065 [Thermomicrobiales bacterium]|nr:hypothetical protein [Thermomicrobiales bacterium]
MAVTRQVDAQTIGRLYVESVRDLGTVRSVHVRETRDWLEVWVVTEPIDIQNEEPLYEAGVNLRHRFPDASILIRLANPSEFPERYEMLRDVVPMQAEAVAESH